MPKALIICPVGGPITNDPRYNKFEHWRITDAVERFYETIVVQYSDFEPEFGTYDKLIKMKGFKWSMAKELLKTLDYSKYDFIGFMDDDLVTDIDNMNKAIHTAYYHSAAAFQLSVTPDSDIFWPILVQKPGVVIAYTNFIEVMGMFISTRMIPRCRELWDQYDIYTGWGFDKVLCDLMDESAMVIHCSSMYHPKKQESTYDKTAAFVEMDHLLLDVFPNFMSYKYNKEWRFKEKQEDIKLKMETT